MSVKHPLLFSHKDMLDKQSPVSTASLLLSFTFTCFASPSLLTSFLPSLHRGKEQQAWCARPTHIPGPCCSLADPWSTFYVLSQIFLAWSVSGPWPCSWAFWTLLQLHLSFYHYCVILRHLQVALSPMEEALGSRTASITLTAAGAVRPTGASPPLTASTSEEGLTGQELWLPQ